MSRVLAALTALALAIYCLVECVQSNRTEVRHLPKVLWLLLIVVIPVVGPLAWLLLGRPRHGDGGAPARSAPQRRAPGPRAPDDDPDFLAQLDERRRRTAREHERRDHDNGSRYEGDRNDEDPEPRGGSGS